MRVLRRVRTQNNSIILRLAIEHPDDLWCLYNIAFRGDIIEAFTSRKVKRGDSDSLSVKQEIKKFLLKISIEKITYTSSYDDLQISGRNVSENKYIRVGQYHTVEIRTNSTITLYKDEWNSFCDSKLSDVTNLSKLAEQAFLIVDSGKASLFFLLRYTTKQVFNITCNVPIRKASNTKVSANRKALESFFKSVLKKLSELLEFSVIRSLVITGPGVAKEELYDYIKENSLTLGYLDIHKNLRKIVICDSSFSDRNAINEVFSDASLSRKINDLHYYEHDKALKTLRRKLESNEDAIRIGFNDVYSAAKLGAIETVFISDELVRNASSDTRKNLQELVDEVKGHGGNTFFLSDEHYATDFIKNLMDIAAILRFDIQHD